MNVVSHLKYCMKQTDPKFHLVLEYKYAKPSESIEGNKKFEKILKNSEESVIVMNGNRETKRFDYVHLQSMTYPNEF